MDIATSELKSTDFIEFIADDRSFDCLQTRLARFNRARLSPTGISAEWRETLLADLRLQILEGEFLEAIRTTASAWLSEIPTEASKFVLWFEKLRDGGPGQGHSLFPWLAQSATEAEMSWFLRQEISGEAGFDDLVAMTQVKLPERPKLEMARNYWDEMGQGNRFGMHGRLLERLGDYYRLHPTIETTVPESLALANLMVGLAANRRYAYQSIGALGVIELTAPSRAVHVNAGLKRLGVPAKIRNYFALHSTLDVRHSREWNREIIAPLVETDPLAARAIAEGALMRLQAGSACFERYNLELRAIA